MPIFLPYHDGPGCAALWRYAMSSGAGAFRPLLWRVMGSARPRRSDATAVRTCFSGVRLTRSRLAVACPLRAWPGPDLS